jgi:hypothetical protein
MHHKRLRRRDAAQCLRDHGYPVAAQTLARFACEGGGPPYILYGRIPLYDPDQLLEWAEARCSRPRRSTSEGP